MGVFSTSEILSASCFNFSTMRPGVMVLLTVCLERESRLVTEKKATVTWMHFNRCVGRQNYGSGYRDFGP
jgi:hypothetical protein